MNFGEELNCKSCSKESYSVVPIARVIEKLNEFFEKNDLDAVGRTLDYWEREARLLGDERRLLELLNEKIGYYRRINDAQRGLTTVAEAFDIIERVGLEDTISSATVYLNGATTMKAFGKAAEAMKYYDMAKSIYEKSLASNDYKFAAFYNNVASAYIDIGDTDKAEECYLKAVEILKAGRENLGEMAVTYVNMAHLYYDADPFDERIYEIMDKAWECLSSNQNIHNGDFAFLCSKCAPSFGFFGYFNREIELKHITESIYERN